MVSLKPARCSSTARTGEAEARGSQQVQGQPGPPVPGYTGRLSQKSQNTQKRRDLPGALIPFPSIVFDQMVESHSLSPDRNDSAFPEVNS